MGSNCRFSPLKSSILSYCLSAGRCRPGTRPLEAKYAFAKGEFQVRCISNSSLLSVCNEDLTSDERIHFTLYRRQQIDIGVRYME